MRARPSGVPELGRAVAAAVDEEAQHKHEAQTALLTSFCGGSSSRVLEPGQYFGEVAVLLPHCDTVGTATAMENVTLLRFDKVIRISRQKAMCVTAPAAATDRSIVGAE